MENSQQPLELMNQLGLDAMAYHLTEQRLLDKRTIFVSEGINAAVAKRVINQLLALEYENQIRPLIFI